MCECVCGCVCVIRWLYKSVTIDRIDRYFSLRLSARKTSPEAIQSVHLIYIGYYFDLVVFNDIRLDLIAVAASSSSSFLRSSFPFQWKSEEQSNRNRNVSSHHFFSFVDNSSVELITVFLWGRGWGGAKKSVIDESESGIGASDRIMATVMTIMGNEMSNPTIGC